MNLKHYTVRFIKAFAAIMTGTLLVNAIGFSLTTVVFASPLFLYGTFQGVVGFHLLLEETQNDL